MKNVSITNASNQIQRSANNAAYVAPGKQRKLTSIGMMGYNMLSDEDIETLFKDNDII